MPRITVTAETPEPSEGQVLLDELVHSVHLSSDHGAAQLVERIAWAISDAEEAELARPARARPQKADVEPTAPHAGRRALAA